MAKPAAPIEHTGSCQPVKALRNCARFLGISCSLHHRSQKRFGMGMAPEERFGPGIGQSLVGLELSLASGRQLRDTATRVVGMRYGPDEAFFLQPA